MNRIKELRKFNGIKQIDLCTKLDISQGTLSGWENEKYEPDLKSINEMCDIFNVSSDYLLCRTSWIVCPICHNLYDPLNEYDSAEHDIFHKKFVAAEEKYGEILIYGEADEKRSNAISTLNNPTLSTEERIAAFEDYLRYEFMLSIQREGYSLEHDEFNEFCKKELGLAMTKEVLDNIGDNVYQRFIEKYGVADDADYHKVVNLTPKDNRDIKNDIDNIMEKLSSKEYGPAAYDGEDLSPESMELFRDELEIALKRLKLINKEKYNPSKNKK